MKAKDLEIQLKEFYTTNKDGKGSGFGKRLIELYARIQIEKDRNEVKKLIRTELQDFPDMASELIFSIDNTPINLD